MKQLQFITAAFCLLIFSTSCHRGNSIMISNGDDNLNITYSGDIKFNDDETSIRSISQNGYLKYKKNDKTLIAENNSHGEIKYEMEDNGRKINPNDDEGKSFLTNAVKNMIEVGFDAKGRMDRIYKKGGSRAILEEIDNLKSDYVKSMYIEYLFSVDSISQEEMKSTAKKIGTKISSDYDKGRLLSKFPADYLKDSLTAHAWFESAKSVSGDYDKANALKYIARQALTKEQFNQTVDVANTIGSDYEKANVLKELIFKSTFAEENFDKTIDAVSYIGSDYEKANLLKALIEKERPNADHFNKLLDVTAHVGSDFDKSNLIKEMIETGLPTGIAFDKLLSAVIHTNSEFDKANLLKYITSKNVMSQEQWAGIINATAEISSDGDKSNLLVSIAPSLPKNDSLKMIYMRVAKTINNETDLGRAIKAME